MITNDRQYKIAKAQIDKFEHSLEDLDFSASTAKDIHPKLWEVQKNAIQAQLNELLSEVQQYESLKAGKIVIAEINNLKDLPLALIQARIANGMTQAELAEKVGVKMQQIQRYEAEQYETASVKTLLKIADHLGIKLNAEVQIKSIEAPENLDIKNYPFKQMFQRKWFGNFSGSFNDAVIDSKNLLEKFFEAANFKNFQYSLTKKTIRSGSTLNPFALDAWYAQIITKAKDQKIQKPYKKGTINDQWLRSLAEISLELNGPAKAGDYLRNSGIRFIIEPQLEGTFLDGAALLWEENQPIVAMTLRHDRLDNFWFVLFHEIAHIQLHLSDALTVIFDDLDVKIEGIEKEADNFALNALIPDDVWRKSLVRFSPSNETILNQAKILKVHPALVAGRIRRETGRYYQYSDLVGQGEVRSNFSYELKN
jgi:HTH-type transcriptional regulator/antitoxin HigA